MQPGHLNRILRQAGVPGLLEALSDRLSPADYQSLMLEVAKRRSASITPARLIDRWRQDRFVQPASADVRAMIELDRKAFSVAAPEFEAVELSPVCPLGTVSALGTVSQNNVISTARNTEVVADSTNCLALECAKRRGQEETVRLCSSHRLIRAQPFSGPASFAHFRIFTMCMAGRDTGSFAFETAALTQHLHVLLEIIEQLRQTGYTIGRVRATLTDYSGNFTRQLERVAAGLEFPNVLVELDPNRSQGRGYYDPVSIGIYVSNESGEEFNIGDGGFTDWTAKLLSNRKERFFASALGTERLCYLFAPR